MKPAGVLKLTRPAESHTSPQPSERWPKDPSALARAWIGRELEDAYGRMAGIYAEMVRTEPETLAGAAVLLRRVPALLDSATAHNDRRHIGTVARLVDAALSVMEREAA